MRKLWLVVKREYLTRVRTKGFIISTIALPLLTMGVLLLPLLIVRRQADETVKIAILDEAGGLAAVIAQSLERKLPSGKPAFQVTRTVETPGPAENEKARQELRAEVSRGELDAFLVVPKDVLAGKAATLHTRSLGEIGLTASLRRAVGNAAIARRLKDQGIRIENPNDLFRAVEVTPVKVTKEGDVEEKGQTFAVAMGMALVLYTTLLVYGLATLRSVLEEKTTRIVEVLVSSLRPFQLLAGKLLGVAAVGFTQYVIWTVSGGLLATYGAGVVAAFSPQGSPEKIHIPISLLVSSVIYYVAGYFLFASLYAAAGAMVSSDEEAQQVQMPMTLVVVLSFLFFPFIMRNPNSTTSVVLSLVPFFSPILMTMRIALQMPPFWQIALSLALMLVTTIGIVYLSAKIYRVGILMYGKRPSLVELLRWLRYT
jgi:ABC-2 type transport system permease protein